MFAERVKERRKKAHLTQRQLGEAVGCANSTVSNWEKGFYIPDIDTVEKVAKVLDTSAGYLLGYMDDPDALKLHEGPAFTLEWISRFNNIEDALQAYEALESRAQAAGFLDKTLPIAQLPIPMLGTIHAGEPTYAEEEFESYVEAGATVRCDFALRVVGDSMINARILDGDIVFIRRQDTVADGEIAAVLIDDETTLKRVRRLPGGMLMLQPENPKYQPIIAGGENETRTIRILGKAVAFQSDVR